MECNRKKAECIIHFTNYLMEDTSRTNTLSSVILHAGFQLMDLLAGRQSCQASHTTSRRHDLVVIDGPVMLRMCSGSSSCVPRDVVPLLLQVLQMTGGLGSMKGPRAATAGCIFWREGGDCQAAEPLFSGQGCVCESHSAMTRKVKLSAENNILVKHS